jgi:hypothetical protein
MSNDSVERVCEVCNQEIPKWRSKSATVCSFGCQLKRRAEKRQAASDKRKEKRKTERQVKGKDSILFHDCVFGGGGGIDPFVPERCRCRKLVSKEQAQNLIDRGEALDLETRTPTFLDRDIVQIGKLLKTPRSATIEAAHSEKLVGITKSYRNAPTTSSFVRHHKKIRELSLEELQEKAQEHQEQIKREEASRMEFYNELTMEARRAWIVEVDADVYDAAKRRDWGRALFTNYKEGRTAGGIGIDVGRILGETNADYATQQ